MPIETYFYAFARRVCQRVQLCAIQLRGLSIHAYLSCPRSGANDEAGEIRLFHASDRELMKRLSGIG